MVSAWGSCHPDSSQVCTWHRSWFQLRTRRCLRGHQLKTAPSPGTMANGKAAWEACGCRARPARSGSAGWNEGLPASMGASRPSPLLGSEQQGQSRHASRARPGSGGQSHVAAAQGIYGTKSLGHGVTGKLSSRVGRLKVTQAAASSHLMNLNPSARSHSLMAPASACARSLHALPHTWAPPRFLWASCLQPLGPTPNVSTPSPARAWQAGLPCLEATAGFPAIAAHNRAR